MTVLRQREKEAVKGRDLAKQEYEEVRYIQVSTIMQFIDSLDIVRVLAVAESCPVLNMAEIK